MTIVIDQRKEESPIAPAIRMARKAARHKLGALDRLVAALEKEGKAMIRAHAKMNGLKLQYHPKPWVFVARKSGEKVALPAGYFAVVDGVLHDIRVAL